jgi:hypothetical protein
MTKDLWSSVEMHDKENNNEGNVEEFVCSICKTRQTPMWRKGPAGKNTLCNRCGIKWSRIQNPRKKLKRPTALKDYKNNTDGTLSEDSPLVQPSLSPTNSDREGSCCEFSFLIALRNEFNFLTISSEDINDAEDPTTSIQDLTNQKQTVNLPTRKTRTSSSDLPYLDATRSSSRPKKRKPSPPPRHRVTRSAKRSKHSIKSYDSDSDSNVPSVLNLLQKIRDSKILINVEVPEPPLEAKHTRFFEHAKQELQKAEEQC